METCKSCNKSYCNCSLCSVNKVQTVTKVCSRCKVNKPLGDFYSSKAQCISCIRENQNVIYHCDICNMDVRSSSKLKHIKS